MPPKLAWETTTNTERRRVLDILSAYAAQAGDGRPFEAAAEALQSIAPTVHAETSLRQARTG